MLLYKTEGIVLSALNYQDYDQIISVFSLQEGLLKFIVKKAHAAKAKQNMAMTPLAKAEFIYTKGRSELYKCQEAAIINSNLPLRKNFQWLTSGCELTQSIQQSQLLHRPAPELYRLLVAYLEKVPLMEDPALLPASMQLKILRYEGLYCIGPVCEICHRPLKGFYTLSGEMFCKSHASSHALCFDNEEASLLEHLAFCQNFSQLKNLKSSAELTAKIKSFFRQSIAQ